MLLSHLERYTVLRWPWFSSLTSCAYSAAVSSACILLVTLAIKSMISFTRLALWATNRVSGLPPTSRLICSSVEDEPECRRDRRERWSAGVDGVLLSFHGVV